MPNATLTTSTTVMQEATDGMINYMNAHVVCMSFIAVKFSYKDDIIL